MNKLFIFVLVLLGILVYLDINPNEKYTSLMATKLTQGVTVKDAFEERLHDQEVTGGGKVVHMLLDDNEGSRHQKFILQLDSGQTVLIAHNIDIAPRLKGLQKGDRVDFKGEYEWNAKGGIIHWTHDDPNRKHQNGWIKYRGRVYR